MKKDNLVYEDDTAKDVAKKMVKQFKNQEVKKKARTLSNPTFGGTKQSGFSEPKGREAQDDTRLQIERSASLFADTQLPDIIIKHTKIKDMERINFAIRKQKESDFEKFEDLIYNFKGEEYTDKEIWINIVEELILQLQKLKEEQ